MNPFSTFLCFALVSCAVSQPAYNYQQPKQVVTQTYHPTTSISNPGVYSNQQAPAINSFNVQTSPLPSPNTQFVSQPIDVAPIQNQYIPPPQISGPTQGEQFANPAPQYAAPVQQQSAYTPSNGYQQYQQPQQQTIISKDIYIHSAPEETEEISSGGADAGPIRKNYRIVFIKAPTQNIKLNLQSLKDTQAGNEEKTIIYVLSKKPDFSNIQSQLASSQAVQKVQKPEVYFIKYRTQEEANRAQQEIQAQYDALGGSTHISDEGIAPVTSVINGGTINVGSVGSGFATSASGSASSFASHSNFAQSASSNQQQFIQHSFGGNQGAGSANVNFAVEAPKQKYLPVHKK